jgi:IclR family KDG regulon transcriptional repressor
MNTTACKSPVSQYFNPTVAGNCEILDRLASLTEPVSVTDLADSTRLTRGTALRVMRTLTEIGIARGEDGAKYVAGPRLISIGLRLNSTSALGGIVRPYLEQLTELTGETSHFAIAARDKSLIVAVCDCSNALRVASRAGTEVWIHAAATGKVFLSAMTDEVRRETCARLHYEKLTPNTLTSSQSLLKHLEQVSRQGFAVDDEEYILGVRCLAAPVFLNANDSPVGAIGITSATVRFTHEQTPAFAAVVQATASELSRALQSDSSTTSTTRSNDEPG